MEAQQLVEKLYWKSSHVETQLDAYLALLFDELKEKKEIDHFDYYEFYLCPLVPLAFVLLVV